MVIIKTKEEIQKLAESNQIAGKVLTAISNEVKPGLTTMHLNDLAERIIIENDAVPGFKNYRRFKYTICASVNHQIIHGIPTTQKLKSGDIVSVDVGVLKNGYYGDTAITIPVGRIDKAKQNLIDITRNALYEAISAITPDTRVGDISKVIHDYVNVKGHNVIFGYGGHGVGATLHEEPFIPNIYSKDHDTLLKEGMVIAIEPMVVEGTTEITKEKDGWTVSTKDGGCSAHFEHTVLVGRYGTRILSKREGEGI